MGSVWSVFSVIKLYDNWLHHESYYVYGICLLKNVSDFGLYAS